MASGSATRPCGCLRTTARSPARRSRRRGATDRSSTSRTAATSTRPCTGTGCGSRTATTARTRPRRRSRSARRSRTRSSSPTPALYWYHPHIREDYGQELGLYGNILVVPPTPTTGRRRTASRAHARRHPDRGRRIAPFGAPEPTHVAMGRFGNSCSSPASRTSRSPRARRGRPLYLTNTANTRVFNVALPGARMKLVGGDSGRYEHEELVDEVLSRRRSASSSTCCSTEPGELTLEHRRRSGRTRSRRSRSPDERPDPRSRGVRACATTPTWRSASGSSRSWTRPGQDARVRRRDGLGAPERWGSRSGAARRATSARCTRRCQRRAPTAARTAA